MDWKRTDSPGKKNFPVHAESFLAQKHSSLLISVKKVQLYKNFPIANSLGKIHII